MTKAQYALFEALNPFFGVVLKGLQGLVDGKHYFETFAEDALFESRYHFPGWPPTIRGRANLMAGLTKNIRYQQNLTRRRIAILVLENAQWPILRPHVGRVVAAVNAATPGSYTEVQIPHAG